MSWTAFSELSKDVKAQARDMAAAAFPPSARTQSCGVSKRRCVPRGPKWRLTPRLAAVEAVREELRGKAESEARSRKRKRMARLALVEGDEWVEHEHAHEKSRSIVLSQDDDGIL